MSATESTSARGSPVQAPGGTGIWREGAQVVLIPAFPDVPGEPRAVPWRWHKVLCAVRDVLLQEIAEGQQQKTPCETPQ